MIVKLLAAILRDRRGATALIIAVMFIPMVIASGAAVDFSRVSAARAQLQSAVDAAALAGAGAYQVNKDGTIAYNVAKTAFTTATTNLNLYSVVTSTIGTLCNPSGAYSITCGTTSGSNGTTALCPATTPYCVQVNARASLQNSLLAIVIPTDVLNVTSVAQTSGTANAGNSNIAHAGGGFGPDSVISTATPLPVDSSGNPIYGNPSAPNSNCQTPAYGILQYLPSTPAANGVTTCNYVILGTNSATSGTGTLGSNTNPLDFTLESFTGGGTTTGYNDLDTTVYNPLNGVSTNTLLATPYYNELYVTVTVLGVGTTTYYPTGTIISGVAAYGYCPAHNLYGSIEAYPNATTDIVPYQDSINVFSSAWEMVGYPPTHSTNHALLPFLGPANNSLVGPPSVTVRAVCPQWPAAGTNIAATAMFTPASLPSGYSPVTSTSGFPAETVKVYSTYYPDVTYTSGTGIYPPVIAGCTAATNTAAGGGIADANVTPAADNPWWGWSPPNNYQFDPGGAPENPGAGAVTDCTTTKVYAGLMTYTLNATQGPTYNDCALIIQPLGSSVPTTSGIPNLPDYYTYLENTTAFAGGTTGNYSGIVSSQTSPLIGMTPVFDGTGNAHAAGYVPTTVTITGSGPYTVTEPPVFGRDNYPPEDTSHQCYNPQANGIDGTTLPSSDQPNNDSPVTPIDPVENPQLGAVTCNSSPAQSYAVYWNDMGSYMQPPRYNDDLDYANSYSVFTCPTPASPGGTGPPALIY